MALVGALPGQIAYGPLEALPTGIAPGPIATGDWNGDGFADFAAADLGTIVVVLGTCVGSQGPATVYTLPPLLFSFVRGIAVGDLDGDGHPDLVAVRAGGYPSVDGVATVLRNYGDGTFAAAVDFPVFVPATAGSAMTPHDVAIVDMDGDGALDVVAVATQLNLPGQPGYFAVARNGTSPGGPLALAAAVNIATTRQNASALVARDLDGDGDVDLAATNRTDNSIAVLRNDGTGLAGAVRTTRLSGTNAAPLRLAAGDLNGDGFLDLVALNYFGNSYSIVLNLNGGTDTGRAGEFADNGQSPVGSQVLPSVSLASDVQLADCDGDGNLDLVVGLIGDYGQPGSTAILTGNGQAAFGAEIPVAVGPDCNRIVVADLDRDGDLDVVASSNTTGSLLLLDNVRLLRWRNLGSALPGTRGAPCMAGFDLPGAALDGSLRLRNSVGPTVVVLAASIARLDVPFAGGVIIPDIASPAASLWFLRSDAQGRVDFDFSWASLPSGLVFYGQFWIADGGGAYGLAATNGLRGQVP